MNILTRSTYLILSFTLASTALSNEVGDPAPALRIKHWVKGDPVDLNKGGDKTIFVIDFWATWNPSARLTAARVNDLASLFKTRDVVFVGVSDEDASAVKAFAEEMGGKVTYTLATDDNHQTTEAYMQTFGVSGVPHSFVIDQEGKVVWHGHPMGDLRNVLTALVQRKFDGNVARRASETEKASQDYLRMARAGQGGDELKELGENALKNAAANPEQLNHLAWTILTAPDLKVRDKEFALRTAKAAFDAVDGKQPSIIDTYAKALFENGKIPEAIATQKTAVQRADPGRMKEQFEKTLAAYEAQAAEQKSPEPGK